MYDLLTDRRNKNIVLPGSTYWISKCINDINKFISLVVNVV